MITKQQHRLLMYIQECIESRGTAPTYEEMKNALGLKSKSGVHRLATVLEDRGYINRETRRRQAIEVLRKFKKTIPRRQEPIKKRFIDEKNDTTIIPLYGKIAAGTPIAAIADPNDFIDVPGFMLGVGNFYALTIEGDSMDNAGIFNNDVVVIKKQSHAKNGDIVVALIDKEEATLKKIKYTGKKILLQSANKNYKTYQLPPESVIVQGVLCGLIRRYK
ncbi:MAG: transcriptional repressor LexA [Alphaproteobacteria bacterium]